MLDQNIIIAKQKWAQQVVTNAKSILVRNKKIATGALYNSVRYVVLSNGDIQFEYDSAGKWVQLGRKPGGRFPPPNAISKWIKAKGIKAVSRNGKPISEESLTYLISRGIAEKGIRPVPFMREAIKQSIKQLARELKKEATKATVSRLRAAAKSINKP
jgi:hypothetical protein